MSDIWPELWSVSRIINLSPLFLPAELSDIWLLSMEERDGEEGAGWAWHQMVVEGLENRGKDIWRHPACRVTSQRVVVLGRSRVTAKKTKDPYNQVRRIW
jgi:hypothetical protein